LNDSSQDQFDQFVKLSDGKVELNDGLLE
jgi:hypothetical protein